MERLRGAAARADRAALADALESAEGRVFFSFLCGNSPYLSRLLLRDLEFTEGLVAEPPGAVVARIKAELEGADPGMPRDALMTFLRRQRSRVAVVAAAYDCFGVAGVMECAKLLSEMADHAVRLAATHLLRDRMARGELAPAGQGDGGESGLGYFVLAMGKHGSGELNYSSDVDLIVLYDPEAARYTGPKSLKDCFVRVTRDLARILQARTGDGYVFRTDLRLRPDASSTPPAITVDFAADYYERLGRTWERAAMIKARPVAGDLAAGQAFMKRLSSFVWEEGLDFTSVEEIRSMSQQIHDFHGHGAVRAPGHDVKLGRGGIREIEFFVHMHQLAYGGRNRRLRDPGILSMLQALEDENHVLPREAADLGAAYVMLRRVEHRLQMVNDDQTQKLPESTDGMEHIAAFMGMESAAALAALVEESAAGVHAIYRTRFNVPESEQDITAAVLEGPEGSEEAVARLKAAGFQRALTASETFRGWAAGVHPSTRSERARTTVREILHEIIDALGKTPDPDRALARMNRFLQALPEDVAFFSMLRANTWLLNLIAVVMGSAPRIADALSANPALLQAVLDPAFFLTMPDRAELAEELAERLEDVDDPAERLARTTGWASDRRFQAGVQTLQNLATVDEASEALTDIADVTLSTLLDDVLAALEKEHGQVPGRGCAVLGLGKLGAREMTFESDLDLIFFADVPGEGGASSGPRPIEAKRYWARAAQQLIAALQSRSSASGKLYEVDMRLRPSGKSGPLVTTLDAFRAYHEGMAETWEEMSLTRSRVVCGTPAAREAAAAEVEAVLTRPRDADALRLDVARMRRRVAAEYPSEEPFELKYVRGGLVDLEFVAQYLQLMHADAHREVLAGGTARCFEALEKAGALPRSEAGAESEAGFLAGAVRFQRAVQALLRLAWSESDPVRDAPETLKRKLANALEHETFDELDARLRDVQARALERYRAHVGDGAA